MKAFLCFFLVTMHLGAWAFPQQHADLSLLSPALANFWYPVHFCSTFEKMEIGPFELLGEQWMLWKDPRTGEFSCVLDQCPHRGTRLSLGNVNPSTGCLRCAYHGWEFGVDGKTTMTPSVSKCLEAEVGTLPVREYEDLLWVWPGEQKEDYMEREWQELQQVTTLPKDSRYTKHGEFEYELDVDHSFLIDNVCDVAHIPFVHQTSFAKNWAVPASIKFRKMTGIFEGYGNAAGVAIGGAWWPYPIDHGFQPPCIVISNSGVKKKNQIGNLNVRSQDCRKHFHQLHICLPSKAGHVRLLYRLHTDFLGFTKYLPGMHSLWKKRAAVPLTEDLFIMQSQQRNMENHGANVGFAKPCEYDALSVLYRQWRDSTESAADRNLELPESPVRIKHGTNEKMGVPTSKQPSVKP